VDIASPSKGEITGKHGYKVTVTKSLPEVDRPLTTCLFSPVARRRPPSVAMRMR